jgi:hypothetical protein
VALVFVSLHLLNGLARLGGFLTEILVEPDADPTTVGERDD